MIQHWLAVYSTKDMSHILFVFWKLIFCILHWPNQGFSIHGKLRLLLREKTAVTHYKLIPTVVVKPINQKEKKKKHQNLLTLEMRAFSKMYRCTRNQLASLRARSISSSRYWPTVWKLGPLHGLPPLGTPSFW